MFSKRESLIVIVAAIVALAVGIGPRVADSARASSPAERSAAQGLTIPYPGRLTSEAGEPVVDGLYDLAFALYETPTGGVPLWSELQEAVTLSSGSFATALGSANAIPPSVLETDPRWLAVGVRGPGDSEFTVLSPRQQLSTAAPAAPDSLASGAACAHDHLGESWNWGANTGNGLTLTGSVPWANGLLKVTNYQNGPTVWGVNIGGGNAVRGDGYGSSIGVYGEGASGPGVVGRSASGRGVEGHTSSADAWAPAVYGSNEGAGDGVYGLSKSRHGVYGVTQSSNADHAGVYAKNNGSGPAIHSDGDLYVTGAFRGNIGSGGAPFPRPAYDSGWQNISKGGKITLNHNLGGNRDNYVIDLQFKDTLGSMGVHNYLYGGQTWDPYLGVWWEGLTTTQISVQRMSQDEWIHQVRVRIWVYR